MEKIGEPKFGGIRGQPGEGGSGGEGRSHATDEVVFFSDAGGGMRQSPQEAARRRRRWRRLKNGGALKPQSQVTGVPRLISFHFSLSYSAFLLPLSHWLFHYEITIDFGDEEVVRRVSRVAKFGRFTVLRFTTETTDVINSVDRRLDKPAMRGATSLPGIIHDVSPSFRETEYIMYMYFHSTTN
ncbi:hypothetical protein V9T40_005205 [Parthenolecanium corni]|uniref:Uncharacterized protein n=1 Tax=Parthenolecanium corni TaxID=536013 RepID=A0AAN9TDQ3_9HEMI